jgi:hypothetical protein
MNRCNTDLRDLMRAHTELRCVQRVNQNLKDRTGRKRNDRTVYLPQCLAKHAPYKYA